MYHSGRAVRGGWQQAGCIVVVQVKVTVVAVVLSVHGDDGCGRAVVLVVGESGTERSGVERSGPPTRAGKNQITRGADDGRCKRRSNSRP